MILQLTHLPSPNLTLGAFDAEMTEPPAKRSKRTDSSAMWDRNSDSRRTADNGPSHHTNGITNGHDRREERDRRHDRDDRKYRSRSRDRRRDRSRSPERPSKRRDRSWSPERDSRRYKDGRRDGAREKRYEDRSRSRDRDRHRSRRGQYTLNPPSQFVDLS